MNVEAVGSTSDVIKVLNKTPVKGSGLVPESIVNYVMRTGEVFITDDIRSEARLSSDVYLITIILNLFFVYLFLIKV